MQDLLYMINISTNKTNYNNQPHNHTSILILIFICSFMIIFLSAICCKFLTQIAP